MPRVWPAQGRVAQRRHRRQPGYQGPAAPVYRKRTARLVHLHVCDEHRRQRQVPIPPFRSVCPLRFAAGGGRRLVISRKLTQPSPITAGRSSRRNPPPQARSSASASPASSACSSARTRERMTGGRAGGRAGRRTHACTHIRARTHAPTHHAHTHTHPRTHATHATRAPNHTPTHPRIHQPMHECTRVQDLALTLRNTSRTNRQRSTATMQPSSDSGIEATGATARTRSSQKR